MKAWLIGLSALVLHKGYYLIDDVTTRQNVFYVAQGLNAIVLYGVIAWLLRASLPLLLAVVYGATEQALVVACGLFHIGYQFTEARDLCDASSVWQWPVLIAVALAFVLWRRRGNT